MPRMWTNPYYNNGDDNDRQRPPSASEPGGDPHAGGGYLPHQHHLPHHGGLPPGHLERAHSSGSVPPGYHPASFLMQGSYPPPHPDPRYAYPPPQHHHGGGHGYAPDPRYEGGGGGAALHGGYAVGPAEYAQHHHSEDEDDDDEDDDDEEEEGHVTRPKSPPSAIPRKEPRIATSDDEDDDEDDDVEEPKMNGSIKPAPPQSRGKPEAMAIALAAASAETTREELAANSTDDPMEVEVVVEATPIAQAVSSAPASKPKPKPTKKKSTTPAKKKATKPASTTAGEEPRTELLLEEEPTPITPEEYENLEALMMQFCRVPLLAEFSRPVSLLHPELAASYEKIVKHPVDLGHVCRGIRRRQYENTRDVRLDMWRVFANCVKFHSHPHNKEAVPTFVSIALHLREYFNSLWQEYMLPSELSRNASSVMQQAFAKRRDERKKRIENSGVLMMSKRFLMKVAGLLDHFIKTGGRVDNMDMEPIFDESNLATTRDLRDVVQNLNVYRDRLEEMSVKEEDHTIEEFIERLKQCYSADDLLEEHPAIKSKFQNRLDRLVGKIYAPLHEANCRGVTQSSIWGNIATTIWARESSKKAYWPALCLGILPPEDQREGWHTAVTERNEMRLPEKIRSQLMGAKKKCESAQKKQSLSYFLVEFLGTHEFIWVRETDIVEKFDRNSDPNKVNNAKKKRSSRNSISNVTGSKTYTTALEECEWATDEFEQLLQEAFDYESDQEGAEDDDGEFMNYSYALLNQSDDEASKIDSHGHVYNDDDMSVSDVDEANWLIVHEGQIDTSASGRKNAKKRTLAMKKKAEKKKEPAEVAKKEKPTKDSKSKEKPTKRKKIDVRAKEREEKREQKEVEKRRKKRTREREKVLRDAKKQKKKRTEEDPKGLLFDKRLRATAIVRAYMNRIESTDEYKSLALNGVMNVPAAIVDSTGLLGMALAFRAASGELSMPDDSEEADAAKFKPWTKIECDKPVTHQERSERLDQKMKLLEKEIERVRANTKRRRELAAEALKEKEARDARIQEDDKMARINPFKKKTKKPQPEANNQGGQTQPADSEEDDASLAENSVNKKLAAAADSSPGLKPPPPETNSPPVEVNATVTEGDK
eukprot:scaffold7349_cov173-Amphora_coffeaeformis.AAC.12